MRLFFPFPRYIIRVPFLCIAFGFLQSLIFEVSHFGSSADKYSVLLISSGAMGSEAGVERAIYYCF
jgi:hypothetical protein